MKQRSADALGKASNGTTAAQYVYGPFGEVIRVTGAMAKAHPLRFSTKYQDDETDLLYYGYRYYNPSTGRWIDRDPIAEQGGVNLQGFCRDDPISGIDPLGEVDVKACVELLGSIYVQSEKLIAELRKYDPVADAIGGFPTPGGPTVPGGHYKEIQNLQRGLKNRLAEFVEKCLKDKTGGGGKAFPRWADQLSNIKVPEPAYNYTGPVKMVQFQIPPMPAIEEATVAYVAFESAERNTQIAKAVGKGAVLAGGCYIVYKGIRLIPSLFPPLWWTLPANALWP